MNVIWMTALLAVLLVLITAGLLWRKSLRARRPLAPQHVLFGQPSDIYINARRLTVMPGSDVARSNPWSAVLHLRLDQSGCEFIAKVFRAQAQINVCFAVGQSALTGDGMPRYLQFIDDPSQPETRFARFNVAGIGELSEVRNG